MHLLLYGLILTTLSASAGAQYASPRAVAEFEGGVRVSLEVADTEALRQRGLMYRTSLAPTEGMIFVFEEKGFYPFWMKNTLIPLDLFWLDEGGTIVSIQHAIPPCGNTSEQDDDCPTFPPRAGTSAIHVIEVVAGFAKRHGIREGQRVALTGLPRR
jgi:uncharacterized membrane protein (UPF0127 family)